jgi:hypothetical protein
MVEVAPQATQIQRMRGRGLVLLGLAVITMMGAATTIPICLQLHVSNIGV